MSESMTSKIATEALKNPVSDLINALIGAKIQRLKAWSEKKDLSSQVSSPAVNALLEEYLRRLIRRISGITTIIFPEKVLPITEIYEPLQLVEYYNIYDPIYFDNLEKEEYFDVDKIEEGKNYLIVDSAGMGKSTYVKHLTLEILDKTNKIPMFLELRRISENETLLGKIASELDETGKHINENLLRLILDYNNFIIILDGYDEVSDQLRKSIGHQITQIAIRNDYNSVILTSRPEVALPELNNAKSYSIKSLTEDQAKSLVKRYDKVIQLDVGERLIKQFHAVPDNFLQTPLLVALLYKTYGFNQSIATRVTSFYDEVYTALYKGHDLTKASFSRPKLSQLDFVEFRELLRSLAFVISIKQKNNIRGLAEGIHLVKDAIGLSLVKPRSAQAFFEDLLVSVPFMIKDGTDYRFIHKSIVEFFTAEFLSYYSAVDKFIEKVMNGHLYSSFTNIFEYLSEINPALFRRLILKPTLIDIVKNGGRVENKYIQTICLFCHAYIGLWEYDKYVEYDDEDNETLLIPDAEFQTSTLTYVNFNNKTYAIAITATERKSLSRSLWKAVTVEDRQRIIPPINSHFDIQKLNFAKEAWISLDDPRVIEIAEDPIIKSLLRQCLRMPVMHLRHTALGKQRRYVDISVCKELIKKIDEESNTKSWIDHILSSENIF